MELHQIRYFLALTRSLNFTRAAETCNVTQPALTKAVQKLELELEVISSTESVSSRS
jgi:DNA-binding transcriptional LysR family regulator